MNKPKILVSACLLGQACAYDGRDRKNGAVLSLGESYELVPVCPECAGGLPTPRVPSERIGDRVFSRDGRDVTEEYGRGAEIAAQLAAEHGVAFAVLKARSPSCGCGEIYDGSFSHTVIEGNGVTAERLLRDGVKVLTERDFA